MKASELRDKSEVELKESLLKLLRDQFNLRMQKGSGQLGQSHLLGQTRRDIAGSALCCGRSRRCSRERDGNDDRKAGQSHP